MPLPQRPRFNEKDSEETPSQASHSLPRRPTSTASEATSRPVISTETTRVPEPVKKAPEEVYSPEVFEEITLEEDPATSLEPEQAISFYDEPTAPTNYSQPSYEEEYSVTTEEVELEDAINSLSEEARENAVRLLDLIADTDSTEVLLNGPQSIMFKQNGQRFLAEQIKFEDIETYHKVINAVILPNTDTNDRIGKDQYLIEGQLELPDSDHPEKVPPLIARVHIIAPPAVQSAVVTIAKKSRSQFTIDTLQTRGSMSIGMANFLKAVARGRATTVFSGLSGSGKTTLLEAMSNHFDDNDRIVLVEDTAELRLEALQDVIPLRSTSHKPGQEVSRVVTLDWLVRQANRMRMDRVIVGEVRGPEMAEFLSAANSGADGSMTTVHASSPRQTIDKIVSLALKSENVKSQEAVYRDIATTVQIIVQTTLVDGKHIVANIEEVSNTVLKNGTAVATTPIFEYDRSLNRHKAVGRPSDELTTFLAQRGVHVDPKWFSQSL